MTINAVTGGIAGCMRTFLVAEPVFDRCSAASHYRSFTAGQGVVNFAASYLRILDDPCAAFAKPALPARSLQLDSCRRRSLRETVSADQ